ncbi:hypothetical protein RvVAT039_pl03030 (plasmid) [Agrobacterium vitis]|nr:hypothetical protein RvVAT039_pl03030 [Agrobacterium vitis]
MGARVFYDHEEHANAARGEDPGYWEQAYREPSSVTEGDDSDSDPYCNLAERTENQCPRRPAQHLPLSDEGHTGYPR